MTAYVVITREVTTNPDELAVYRQKAPVAREGHALTPVAFYGALQVLEGSPIEGAVILSFPTVEEARAWYDSPAYQEALAHRQAGCESRAFIVEGVDAK
ncbi:DUF1330 domain-containing protein [Acuticoccus sediminis]|uniref:DUF1330 domain-containing protein n=1 Tax=Acuticoccus sediminis TaxID=2184697 RepID=A0A8B2NXK8_9HYPH|nr:DUF1330 domain-containing protein [Acuticoccus sediminis]RAI03571.1 DUF1330 domain-containing protein [Acuticoccus sediminis]